MTNHPNRSKKVDRSAINAAELEGKVVVANGGRKYLCTFGNGCCPTALGSKIFTKDVQTGMGGLLYREEIEALTDEIVMESDLPAEFSGFVTGDERLEQVGLSISGKTIWMHKDALAAMTKSLLNRALS